MTTRQGWLLVLLAAIWGGSYLLIKYGLEGFSAAEVVFLRTALGAGVLVAVIGVQGGEALAALGDVRRRPLHALVLGFLAVAAPFMLITLGEKAVPSGLTAVLIAPASLFVAMFAPFLDPTERIGRAGAFGLVVGLVGVALLVGVETVHSLDEFLGALAILAASASYALSSFVVKGPYGDIPPITTSAISVGVGSLLTLPVAAATVRGSAPGLGAVAAVTVLGVVGTAFAFVIFYHLITTVGAGPASLVSYLAPGVALFYGAVFRGERITVAALAGLALILVGVFIAGRRGRPRLAVPDFEPAEDLPALSPAGSAPPQPASPHR
jgi:drug/metabolite transporter (DMT)-like permease